ncbi:MAG: toxic anion resistance protein [Solobacterium sp.]|nr:toxic anion resistance protein [Solobacterium sp.]
MTDTIQLQLENQEEKKSSLSQADLKQAQVFSEKIDITNTMMVMKYGQAAQKKMIHFSESSLLQVPSIDIKETEEILKGLIAGIKEFEQLLGSENPLTYEKFKMIYSRFSAKLTEAARRLEICRSSLLRHEKRLDNCIDECVKNIREFDMYIYAGKRRLQSFQQKEYQDLCRKAERTGFLEDTIAVNEAKEATDRFEKKLYDLTLSRTIPFQTMTHIKVIQNTDILMADSLGKLITDTFSLYRNRIVLSVGLKESENENIKMIDMDLIREADRDLVMAMNAVMKIQSEQGRKQKKSFLAFLHDE